MSAASDAEIVALGVEDLIGRFRDGSLSPLEVTRAHLARIERLNPALNAFTYVDVEGAEAAATASERRWRDGRPASAVDGVPVSIKDLTQVRGMPAREGSLTVSAEPCETDSPPAAKLRDAGAVMLGKTNTPEFGWKAVTDNRVYGVTRNPWDPERTPGGSSGGAAVAAALNLGVLHQGGDSGGSIRIPAAFTGVFGFKPTFGWVPQWPPSKMASLSHLGPLTRTVDDAAAMLNVIGRYDYRDPFARRGQPEGWGVDLGKGVEGLRIAFSPDCGYATVDADVRRRVAEAAEMLERLGARVEYVGPLFDDPLETFRVMWFTSSQALVAEMTDAAREQLDPGLLDQARRGEDYRAIDFFQALQSRAELTRRMEHVFQDYDLLMTPSVPITAFEAGHEVPPDSAMEDWMEWTPFSYPFNLTQQPAASVPCGFAGDGLPVGFQLVGGMFDDTKVLRACEAYQREVPPRFPDAQGLETRS
jgi:aspartyl-tRNA(Asn)/glutamyl-tRNA(Gln) amidotransferase subunit A